MSQYAVYFRERIIMQQLNALHRQLDDINLELLRTINKQGALMKEIIEVNKKEGMKRFDLGLKGEMLNTISRYNGGPYDNETIQHIYKELFKAIEQTDDRHKLLVARKNQQPNTIVTVKGEEIGGAQKHFVIGPCAVESHEQVTKVADAISHHGITFIRGGAFKPRTSPYDFQGLGPKGWEILKTVADNYNLAVVSEVINPAHIEYAMDYVDVIQIGARNMQNFDLLKAVGDVECPVLLKRGFSATLSEFMHAAEYIYSRGNKNIILCERGIRTYEKSTRNTLDITAVPILKKETHLPVLVDVTHSTGRTDLLIPAAKAALAIDADGIMAEVHPNPAFALSDAEQQMDIPMFDEFMNQLSALKSM